MEIHQGLIFCIGINIRGNGLYRNTIGNTEETLIYRNNIRGNCLYRN